MAQGHAAGPDWPLGAGRYFALAWRDFRQFLAVTLALFALIALCACVRPRWFRGYYRLATRLGFYTVQIFGKLVLAAVFCFVLTPFGWIMRLAGKDLLQLKSPPRPANVLASGQQNGSLDSLY